MNVEKMFFTVDTQVIGEAFRIIIQSPIAFTGTDVKANHALLTDQFENEKNVLLNEPRGHRGMNGCIVVPSQAADYQLLFFNHPGANQFKYEALLATTTALLETGNLKRNVDDIYSVETVQGIFTVKAALEDQEVVAVSLKDVVCKIEETDLDAVAVNVDNARNYLIFTLPESISGIQLEYLAEVSNWGIAKTAELMEADVSFDGVILLEQSEGVPSSVRSVTFEKDGYILRSPGIDSTCAILALCNIREPKDCLKNESIFGATLTAKSLPDSKGHYSIEATPYVTGTHEFMMDPEDPLKNGFILS